MTRRGSIARALLLGLVLLSSSVLHAQGAPSKSAFDHAWDQALDAFHLGRYDQALGLFEEARTLAPDKPGPYRYLGRTARALERWQDCVDNTVEAVRRNPRSRFTAEIVLDLEACRVALGRSPAGNLPVGQGAIGVKTNIDGVSVKLDGINRGTTPLEPFPAQPGMHTLELRAEGYMPLELPIDVVPGIVIDLEVSLDVAPGAAAPVAEPLDQSAGPQSENGRIALLGSTEGFTVTVDGAPVALDANGMVEVAPGAHEVVVHSKGRVPYRVRLTVSAGQTKRIVPQMRLAAEQKRFRRRGVIALGASAAAATVGVVFGAMENAKRSEASDLTLIERRRPDGATVPAGLTGSRVTSPEELQELRDDSKRAGLISKISFGVAAAALGVSVYYLVKGRRDSPREKRRTHATFSVVPALSPDDGVGAQVLYSSEFDF